LPACERCSLGRTRKGRDWLMRQQSQRMPKQANSQEQHSLSPLLNVLEAAKLLGIKVWTLRQWLSQRRIAFYKVGCLTKLRQEDIAVFIEANRREAVSHDRELFA
jgi:excisionase family DNA binding protein